MTDSGRTYKCMVCGAENPGIYSFCSKCGAKAPELMNGMCENKEMGYSEASKDEKAPDMAGVTVSEKSLDDQLCRGIEQSSHFFRNTIYFVGILQILIGFLLYPIMKDMQDNLEYSLKEMPDYLLVVIPLFVIVLSVVWFAGGSWLYYRSLGLSRLIEQGRGKGVFSLNENETKPRSAILQKGVVFNQMIPEIKIVIIAAVLVFLGMVICLYLGTGSHTCSRCGKKTIVAYYDPLDTDEYFCEDCAKEYFAPLPYQNYRVR